MTREYIPSDSQVRLLQIIVELAKERKLVQGGWVPVVYLGRHYGNAHGAGIARATLFRNGMVETKGRGREMFVKLSPKGKEFMAR